MGEIQEEVEREGNRKKEERNERGDKRKRNVM